MIDLGQRLAALACLASAYQFAASGFADGRWLVAILLSALIVATAPPFWARPDPAVPPRLGWPSRRWTATTFVPGWLLMLGAAAGKAAGLEAHLATYIWLAGAVWLLAGAWSASRRLPGVATPRSVHVWAVIVVATAAALRVWHMDTVPRYVHHDEMVMSRVGLQYLLHGLDWFTVQRGNGDFTNMPLAFIPAGIGVWIGGSLNLFWARLPDVILGILSVWLVFDGLRRVATTPLAVVAALLLAANHCHVHYSRIASTYMHSAFFVSLLFALFSRLWTAPTYVTAVLLGISGVIGMQTYHASFATLPLLIGGHAAAGAAAAAALPGHRGAARDLRDQRDLRGGHLRGRRLAGARHHVHAQSRGQHLRAAAHAGAAGALPHRRRRPWSSRGRRGRRSQPSTSAATCVSSTASTGRSPIPTRRRCWSPAPSWRWRAGAASSRPTPSWSRPGT